jgi:hypothetical protein
MSGTSDLMHADERMPAPHIPTDELERVQRAAELLIRVINTTTVEHRQAHTAISMHNLISCLPTGERLAALNYLHHVMQQSAN